MSLVKYFAILCLLFFVSCSNSSNREMRDLVAHWENREIQFPKDAEFTVYGTDTVTEILKDSPFKIVSYVDSIGCISCKLQLPGWKRLIHYLDSVRPNQVSVLLFLYPKNNKEIQYILRRNKFDYPVCIDVNDSFNKMNSIPSNMAFQTFLLNDENRIVAIGNPVNNPEIKELYLKIIQDQPVGEEKETIQTQVAVPETSFTFGNFDWQEAQTHSFEVKNVGHELLVIQDVTTSCGCITVDFPKEPVQPGGTAMVKVTYKADQQEYFNKTVTIYGNAEQFPLSLHVSGNARRLTIDN